MSPTTRIPEHRRSARILIADADADTRSLYREALKDTGCDVVDAADGRDALVKALSQRPTLVITETRLPIIDGYALCDVLRRDAQTRTVPILIVTAESRPSQLDRARAAGVDGVLTKPITPEQLLHEIHRVLERGERVPDSPDANPPPNKQARTSHAKAHRRTRTTTPPAPPPQLTCPSCDRPLTYEHSHIGGVSGRHAEQWDAFTCPSCGSFEYRQRTRKLRRVN